MESSTDPHALSESRPTIWDVRNVPTERTQALGIPFVYLVLLFPNWTSKGAVWETSSFTNATKSKTVLK